MLNQTSLFISTQTTLAHAGHDNPKSGLSGTAPLIFDEGGDDDFSVASHPIHVHLSVLDQKGTLAGLAGPDDYFACFEQDLAQFHR
jgi:hypothetical protein